MVVVVLRLVLLAQVAVVVVGIITTTADWVALVGAAVVEKLIQLLLGHLVARVPPDKETAVGAEDRDLAQFTGAAVAAVVRGNWDRMPMLLDEEEMEESGYSLIFQELILSMPGVVADTLRVKILRPSSHKVALVEVEQVVDTIHPHGVVIAVHKIQAVEGVVLGEELGSFVDSVAPV
jgi:hypothetical protein